MRAGKLTALAVRRATKPGRLGDGGGLYLLVKPSGARLWTFRFTLPGGKAREMSLGAEADVSLSEARDLARDARRHVAAARDPIEARREAAKAAEGEGMTFGEVATLYIAAHRSAWRNAKHAAQWVSSLDAYAAPRLGKVVVGRVAVADVLAVLAPIWSTKPETASRLRSRIELVLDFAASRGWRTGDNPARWRGHLSNLLPKRSRLAAVKHHPALPWQEAPAFMHELQDQKGMGALAFRFLVLTAARAGEVTGATWQEVDMAARLWVIPGSRMKAGREHRVPLSAPALEILAKLQEVKPAADAPLFPGGTRWGKKGQPPAGLSIAGLSAVLRRMKCENVTAHGFRSSFRDWCAEAEAVPQDVAEAALAHSLLNKVEAAYKRSDLLERRAAVMERWAAFLSRPAGTGVVVPLRRNTG